MARPLGTMYGCSRLCSRLYARAAAGSSLSELSAGTPAATAVSWSRPAVRYGCDHRPSAAIVADRTTAPAAIAAVSHLAGPAVGLKLVRIAIMIAIQRLKALIAMYDSGFAVPTA